MKKEQFMNYLGSLFISLITSSLFCLGVMKYNSMDSEEKPAEYRAGNCFKLNDWKRVYAKISEIVEVGNDTFKINYEIVDLEDMELTTNTRYRYDFQDIYVTQVDCSIYTDLKGDVVNYQMHSKSNDRLNRIESKLGIKHD